MRSEAGLAPRADVSAGKALDREKHGKTMAASQEAGVMSMSVASRKHSPPALVAMLRRKARYKSMAVAIFRVALNLVRLVYCMLCCGQDYVRNGTKAYEGSFLHRAVTSH